MKNNRLKTTALLCALCAPLLMTAQKLTPPSKPASTSSSGGGANSYTLSFTGTTTKVATSTGALTSGDCAKWDALGNIIDAGAACGSGGGGSGTVNSGTTGQFGYYSSNGSAVGGHTLVAGDIPTLNQSTTGNAATATAFSATPTLCATGYAPTGVTANGNSTGCAAIGSGGGLPGSTGTAGVLINNGSSWGLGNIPTGGSGGLDCATVPGTCDIVTAVVPRYNAVNAFTGTMDSSGAAKTLPARLGSSLPGTCTLGEFFYLTSGTVGLNTCTATNTWTAAGGGGGSTSNKTLVSGLATINLGSCTSGGSLSVFSYSIPGGTLAVGNQLRQKISFMGVSGTSASSSTYLVSTFGNGTSGTGGNYAAPLDLNGNGDATRFDAGWNPVGTSSTYLDGISVMVSASGGYLRYLNLGGNGAGVAYASTDSLASAITTAVSVSCGTTTGWSGTVYARYSLELWY